MQFMTREIFDTIIMVVIIIGLALVVVRLYADFTRPLSDEPPIEKDDTLPNRPVDD